MYELTPIYDARKSFYGKAKVIEEKGKFTLYPYDTTVCCIQKRKVKLLPYWDCSNTTLRHVKEFLRQFGFTADSKKQIKKDYAN